MMALKTADKDILDTLAALEFEAEYTSDAALDDADIDPKDVKIASQGAVTIRRLIREAGYEIPKDFDWQTHFA